MPLCLVRAGGTGVCVCAYILRAPYVARQDRGVGNEGMYSNLDVYTMQAKARYLARCDWLS